MGGGSMPVGVEGVATSGSGSRSGDGNKGENMVAAWLLPRRPAAMWAGLATAGLIVSPPMEEWVSTSLAGHMVQHTVLIGVVAPLVALGAPLPRRRLGPGWLAGAVLLQTVLVLGWHAPPLFDEAEQVPILHGLEHLCLLGGSGMLWWMALRAGGQAGWGLGALAVFVAMIPLSVLGVGMVLAGTPWYAHHHDLVDQQIAGVVMWSGGGLCALVGVVVLGVAWVAAAGSAPPEAGRSG